MTRRAKTLAALLFAAPLLPGCATKSSSDDAPAPLASGAACAATSDEARLSTCLAPTQTAAYYAQQSLVYFDTLDTSAMDGGARPNYAENVARWEWPPWLKLTGYGRAMMEDSEKLVTLRDPSTVPQRDCRAFAVQPFGRCHVTFQYAGGPCAIYEEFTFDDAGEMTFIEAWTDAPAYLPMKDPADRWGEGADVHRLSTKIPGLGSKTGTIVLDGAAMTDAAAKDPDVASFVEHAKDFWGTWFKELADAGEDVYANGCGW